MKREVVTTEQSVEEIELCDRCAMEVGSGHQLVPIEQIEQRLARIEREVIESMKSVDAPDIPEPEYETKQHTTKRKSSGGIVYRTRTHVTTTIAPQPDPHGNIVKEHTGIDADEKELIRKAESLGREREKLVSVLKDIQRSVSGMADFGPISSSPVLCDNCYGEVYGWERDG